MKNQEVIQILLQQIEANVAAIKAAIVDDDKSSYNITDDINAPENKLIEKKDNKKKKKLKVISKEDLMVAFGIHDSSILKETENSNKNAESDINEEININPEDVVIFDTSKRPALHYTDHSIKLSDITGEDENAAEELLGRNILKHLGLEDDTCSVVRLLKKYYDNGFEKLYIDKWHVNIMLLDNHLQVIKENTVSWKALTPFHYQLIGRGINRYSKSDDPHKNYMPQTINLDLG